MSLGSDLKKAGENVLHVVEWPFKNTAELIKALTVVLKDSPAAKSAILGLVQQFMVIPPDVLQDVAANGLNLSKDMQTIADLQAFIEYFVNTFLPAVKSIVGDVETIADADLAPSDTQSTADASEPQPGPGLHEIVPA